MGLKGEKKKQSTLTWMRREEGTGLGGDEGGEEYVKIHGTSFSKK